MCSTSLPENRTPGDLHEAARCYRCAGEVIRAEEPQHSTAQRMEAMEGNAIVCERMARAMLRDSGASCGVGAVGLSLAAAAVGLLVRLLLLLQQLLLLLLPRRRRPARPRRRLRRNRL